MVITIQPELLLLVLGRTTPATTPFPRRIRIKVPKILQIILSSSFCLHFKEGAEGQGRLVPSSSLVFLNFLILLNRC